MNSQGPCAHLPLRGHSFSFCFGCFGSGGGSALSWAQMFCCHRGISMYCHSLLKWAYVATGWSCNWLKPNQNTPLWEGRFFFFFLCVEVLFLIKLCICGSCGVLQVVLCQSVKHLGPIHRVLKGWREPAAPLFALCSCLICTGWGFCCLLSSNN